MAGGQATYDEGDGGFDDLTAEERAIGAWEHGPAALADVESHSAESETESA